MEVMTKKDVGFNTPIPMTTLNSTSTEVISQGQSLLWIPYVVIATVFLGFLGVHFWCYHRKNQEKLSRKLDEKRVKAGLFEKRRMENSVDSLQTVNANCNVVNEVGNATKNKVPVTKNSMSLPVVNSYTNDSLQSNYHTFSRSGT